MKSKNIGIFAVLTFAIVAVGSVTAFGLGHGFMIGNSDSEETQAFHEEVQTAIENNDFEAWKSLMESQLTEEHFNQMVEMHAQMEERMQLREQLREAMQNGDMETANQLREQLQENMPEDAKAFGTGYSKGIRQGFGVGMMHGECPYAQTE